MHDPVVDECASFMRNALEASLYLRPEGLGLTREEILSGAKLAGYQSGTC